MIPRLYRVILVLLAASLAACSAPAPSSPSPQGQVAPSATPQVAPSSTLAVLKTNTPAPAAQPSTTLTPSATSTRSATPAPGQTFAVQGYHTVRAGETLMCIGRAYAVVPQAIASQNKIGDADRLLVGQVLAIPVAPWTPVPAGPVCPRQFGEGAPVPTLTAPPR
ncbi:MAG: LysM peptidoglycan-binding domain-containing protein [Thermoflexales bacterium]|nr:LysM peptidoglycan-binding domain-containing protein [Thermoflexales bacterium]